MVAIVLHWIMAAILVALIILGVYMTSLPDAGWELRKIKLIFIHKELGVIALALVTVRLAWRIGNVLPYLVDTLPDWQKVAARFVHLSLYAFLFALPVSGWLMSSAAGIPVTIAGWELPDPIPRSDATFRRLAALHGTLGYALTLLIFVHAGAALIHHFILRDDTLRRMLPAICRRHVADRPGTGGGSSY